MPVDPISSEPRPDEVIALARLFSAGRHGEVVAAARRLAEHFPSSGVVQKLLGSALQAQGNSAEAVEALRKAVKLLSGDSQAWSNLGNALAQTGQPDEAIQAHLMAIRLQPEVATPRYNLGCVYLNQGRKPEALEQFCLAFDRSPADRDLARLCRQLVLEVGDKALQLSFCRLNVRHSPDDGVALGVLGALLLGEGESEEAESWLREAVRVAPENVAAWSNLCVVLQNRSALSEAIVAGRQAVALAPDWVCAHNNLGTALMSAGAWAEARAAFLRALEVDPEFAEAYYNLGCVCANLYETVTAREALIEAVKRNARPDWLVITSHTCRQLADWEGAELIECALQECLARPGELECQQHSLPAPFAYLTTPGTSAQDQLRISRHFSGQFDGRTPVQRATYFAKGDGVPLRIGLLSSDFRDHATAHLIAGVLEALDHRRFQLVAYDHSPTRDDAYRERLRSIIPEWTEVGGLPDFEAAQRMAADGIHIAIDLKGWTQGFRGGILAYRPAPVQMQWLGFPGTMGADWIDYIVADPVVIPLGEEQAYREKVIRLPHCYQPNDRRRAIGPTPERAALGLPEGALVLAAFHQPYKITRDTFALWLRLLSRLPDAVLWLLDVPPMAKENLCRAAMEANVSPSRLYWAHHVPSAQHLGRLAVADLALDAFPVNAHTTASDALWAGVPQVALCGDTFVSRVSASIARAAGCSDLVASNWQDYENLIVDLALQRGRLAAVRESLAANRLRCPLFDSEQFARYLGQGFEMAWTRYQQGLPPDHLQVG